MMQSKSSILIVEDDPQVRKLFMKKLSSAGFDTIEAVNGKEGLRRYRTDLPDLVITDLIMPEKEGIEMITDMKKEFPDAKIIAVSGGGRNDPNSYLRVAKHLGASQIFTKPIEWPELIAEVRAMLES